jgi:hypothetical protein
MVLLRSTAILAASLVLIASALSGCGGGGSAASNAGAAAPSNNNPTSTSSATPTATASTQGSASSTISGTTTADTGTTTGGPRSTASPYNSCADAAEVNGISNVGTISYQRYVVSGGGFGNEGTKEITTTSEEQQSLNGLGNYYVKSQKVLNTVDGLPIPDSDGANAGKPADKSVAFYQLNNGQIELAGEQFFNTTGILPQQLFTNLYDPVFYDRLFTLSAGQEIVQNKTFVQQEFTGDVLKAQSKAGQAVRYQAAGPAETFSQRIKFLGVMQLTVGPRTYSTCKFEVQDTAPASSNITTKWYLEGRSVLVQAITLNSVGSEVKTMRLEQATLAGRTIYPRTE